MENVEILKKFIVDNNLQFTEGRRNSDCTILSGFALHKECNFDECVDAIDIAVFTTETSIELERVFNYAEDNNYGSWWKSPYAKEQFIF